MTTNNPNEYPNEENGSPNPVNIDKQDVQPDYVYGTNVPEEQNSDTGDITQARGADTQQHPEYPSYPPTQSRQAEPSAPNTLWEQSESVDSSGYPEYPAHRPVGYNEPQNNPYMDYKQHNQHHQSNWDNAASHQPYPQQSPQQPHQGSFQYAPSKHPISKADQLAYWSIGLFAGGFVLFLMTFMVGFTYFLIPLTSVAGIITARKSAQEQPSTMATVGFWGNIVGGALWVLSIIVIIFLTILVVASFSAASM